MRVEALSPSSRVVTLKNGTAVLYSYSTPVAALTPGRGYLRTKQFHSRTTSKHIASWLRGAEASAEMVEQSVIDAIAGGL